MAFDEEKWSNFSGVQMHGVLSKKPVGHKSEGWQRRFFILKESFLLYYSEVEKKCFQEKRVFNIHPKGIIPLSCCMIEESSTTATKYGISVNYPDNTNAISLAADDNETRKKWIRALEVASKITLENCNLGEAMIKSLQEQGHQMAKEKQKMLEKLQRETKDADKERKQRIALEEFNQQLLEEKLEIEMLVDELQLTQTAIKRELTETMKAFTILETDQKNMKKVNENLHESLTQLSSEREAIKKQLEETDEQKRSSSEDKARLLEQMQELTNTMEKMEEEKNKVEERLTNNEKQMLDYENEKKEINENVEHLMIKIKELNQEKDSVETRLKEEVVAKNKLEEQLMLCKEALIRLEKDLQRQIEDSSNEKQQQIVDDMQSLKNFFENFSVETSASEISRRYSRRYNQIRKLRYYRPSDTLAPKPAISHERLSSTPGIESIEECI